jgi:hypothetical protein
MKYMEHGVKPSTSLISAIYEDWWTISSSGWLSTEERTSDNNWTGNSVGPKRGADKVRAKRKYYT